MAAMWKVVGGGDKGGIVVRKGKGVKSDAYEERLATDAVVEEVEISSAGDRLKYKLVSGDGPAEGWVSIKASGKDLVSKMTAAEVAAFKKPSTGAAEAKEAEQDAAAKKKAEEEAEAKKKADEEANNLDGDIEELGRRLEGSDSRIEELMRRMTAESQEERSESTEQQAAAIEAAKKKAEDEAAAADKKKAEEEAVARKKAEEEEEAAAAAKKKAEEDAAIAAAAKKKAEEEAAAAAAKKKAEEEEAAAKKRAEEEEAEAKKLGPDGLNLIYPLTEEALAQGASVVERVRKSTVADPVQRVQEVLPEWPLRRSSASRSGSDGLLVCFTDFEPDDLMAIAQLWEWSMENGRIRGPPLVIFQANLQEKDCGTILEKKQLLAHLMLGLPSYYTLTKDGDTVSDHPQHQGLLDQREAYLDGVCRDLAEFQGSLIHFCVMAPGSGNLAAIVGRLKAKQQWPLRAKWRISMYSGSFNMRGMTGDDLAALNEIMAHSQLPLVDTAKFPFFGGADCHKWTDSLTTFAAPDFARDLASMSPALAAALKLFNDEFNARLIEPRKLIKKELDPEEAARFAKIKDLFDPSDMNKLKEYSRSILDDKGLMSKVPGFKKSTMRAFAYGGCDSPLCDQLIFLHEWLADRRPGLISYEEGYWRYNEEKAFVEIVASSEGLPYPIKAKRPVVASPSNEEHLLEMRRALQDYLMRHLEASKKMPGADAGAGASMKSGAPTAKKEAPLRASVHCDATQVGECVAIVGGSPALGSWDTAKALKMSTSAETFPNWSVEVPSLPAGTEYKFIILGGGGGVRWEPFDSNRKWPAGGAVQAKFGVL